MSKTTGNPFSWKTLGIMKRAVCSRLCSVVEKKYKTNLFKLDSVHREVVCKRIV